MSTETSITTALSSQTGDMAIDADLLSKTNDTNYASKVTSTANNKFVLSMQNHQSHDNCKPIDKCRDQHKSSFGAAATVDATSQSQCNNQSALSRTVVRNSCGSVNGQIIGKSWYARCNRWRSQSCDRRKNSSVRYSWSIQNNNNSSNNNNNSNRIA